MKVLTLGKATEQSEAGVFGSAEDGRDAGARGGGRQVVATTATQEAIDAAWRIESARLIAGLASVVRDVGLAEASGS
jgi:hypothetical protein